MRGIRFNYAPPVAPTALGRMDVACFIGYTPLRSAREVPESVALWWRRLGWWTSEEIDGDPILAWDAGLPVPLESWESYEAMFRTTRVDRVGAVESDALPASVTPTGPDRSLRLLVDGWALEASIQTPRSIGLEALVRQINTRVESASDTAGVVAPVRATASADGARLRLERTNEVDTGELTVYRNEALGFPHVRQQDVVQVENYLSAAVREFFANGGRRCFVVRAGDPLPVLAAEARKVEALVALVWGRREAHRAARRGVSELERLLPVPSPPSPGSGSVRQPNALSYLTVLPEVTYVVLPDLVDLVGAAEIDPPPAPAPMAPEVFVECSTSEDAVPWLYAYPLDAPVTDALGFEVWSATVSTVVRFLEVHAPLVQLVAGLPLPAAPMRAAFDASMTADSVFGISGADPDPLLDPLRRLELAFPWLRTVRSDALPGRIVPPEGALTGVLAEGAITRGAYRSLAGTRIGSAYDVVPRRTPPTAPAEDDVWSPPDRIHWFDVVPGGVEILSDVTATADPTNRYAVVRRIMILVQRAAREMGLSHVFEGNSERTWRAVERKLGDVLTVLYQKRGLRGRTAAEAFAVSCGRATMSQHDIDNGRLIANVMLRPAVPVEEIHVDLLLERDGRSVLRRAG